MTLAHPLLCRSSGAHPFLPADSLFCCTQLLFERDGGNTSVVRFNVSDLKTDDYAAHDSENRIL